MSGRRIGEPDNDFLARWLPKLLKNHVAMTVMSFASLDAIPRATRRIYFTMRR